MMNADEERDGTLEDGRGVITDNEELGEAEKLRLLETGLHNKGEKESVDDAMLLLPKDTRSYRMAPPQKCAPCSLVRVFGSIMVAIVIGLVMLSYIPMWYHYGDGSFGGFLVLLVFHVLLALMMASYFQIVYTDPGTVPEEWHDRVAKAKRPAFPKCRRCGMYKPPRSHYDSATSRLVLNMDHYCPWTNNCIGFFNRKFFILFLVYTALTSIYVFLCLLPLVSSGGIRLEHASKTASAATVTTHKSHAQLLSESRDGMIAGIMTFMALVFDGVFSVMLSIFAGAHILMAMRNQTTIENSRTSKPFRLSTMKNLEQVFGVDKRYWFLPVYAGGPAGDGVHWQLRDGTWLGVDVELPPVATGEDSNGVGLNQDLLHESSDGSTKPSSPKSLKMRQSSSQMNIV